MSQTKDYIIYYVKKLERFKEDENMILTIIHKLSKPPVTAELLKETGIYGMVRALTMKKGKVADAAFPLYNKWKLLLSIAMKNKESPTKLPDPASLEERTQSTPASNNSSTFSKSSADSNASHRSRDSDSERGSKYSEPRQPPRKDHFAQEGETNRPSSASSDHNGLARTDQDSFQPDLDASFNPHLSIEHSDKQTNAVSDDGTDLNSPTKSSRILEPYHIEMREGMFRAVKDNNKNLSAVENRTREIIHREILKGNASYKRERDKSENPHHIKYVDSPPPSRRTTTPSKTVSAPLEALSDREKLKRKLDCSKNGPTDVKPSVTDKSNKKTSHSGSIPGQSKVELKRKSSSPSPSGSKSSDSKRSDRKRDEKRFCPDSSSDHKLKVKSSKEERSPSHVPKPIQNAESHQSSCDRKNPKKMDSPDSAAMNFISSKKERRTIYSGKKTVYDTLSLQDSCVRFLRKNLDLLKFSTKVPYDVLKPVLEPLNASQLYKIEEMNKCLLNDTDELWKQLCNRDYRGHSCADNETWRTVYYKAHREQSKKLKNLTASISASSSKAKPDRQAKLTLVDSTHDPHKKRMKTIDTPIVSIKTPVDRANCKPGSSLTAPKPSPILPAKIGSPSLKPSTPLTSRPKETKHAHKPVKKDAPLMSKVKKSMGLAYRPK